jgi:hypothetical protein
MIQLIDRGQTGPRVRVFVRALPSRQFLMPRGSEQRSISRRSAFLR